MSDNPFDRLRAICLALPEATEKITWESTPTFRVRDKILPNTNSTITVTAGPRSGARRRRAYRKSSSARPRNDSSCRRMSATTAGLASGSMATLTGTRSLTLWTRATA